MLYPAELRALINLQADFKSFGICSYSLSLGASAFAVLSSNWLCSTAGRILMSVLVPVNTKIEKNQLDKGVT